MNLYTVVTGEIRAGDVSRWIDKTLTPVNPFWIGKNASDVEFIVLRPVNVPSEEEMLQAVVNHCQKEIDCENCHSERECYQCYYETMLRLMGIESEQQAKVEICENAIPKDWLCRLDNKICLGQCGKSTEQAKE